MSYGSLADLADDDILDAPVPTFVAPTPRSLRLAQIAPNPYNTRDMESAAAKAKIEEIADSMRKHGQLQASTVVTREAFLAVFPEHAAWLEDNYATATHVQVMGGRRRAAALLLGSPTLDVSVKDQLAESRAEFLETTAIENIEREDLDPIAEARAIELIVDEHGSRKAAAERLGKTPPWVTQRLNLLQLAEEVQAALRAGTLPAFRVRTWHGKPAAEQVELLTAEQDTPVKPARKAAPPVIDSSVVKVRLWGSPAGCEQALAAVRQALTVTSVAEWRADRGSPNLGRVYVEVALSGAEVSGGEASGSVGG